MPDVRNCRRCGRIFNYIGGAPLCPVCKEEDEEDYKRVKQYLYEYPGATMTQVATELNVSLEKIRRFLKDGRLEIVGDDPNFILQCEKCGKSIRTGRYCDACERELLTGLRGISNSYRPARKSNVPISQNTRLRFLGKANADDK